MSKESDKTLSNVPADQTGDTTEPQTELTAGARLREARLARELDLRDVAAKTRQSQETLAALESMETARMPHSILRLQARNYARFLGLPEDEIVEAYKATDSAPSMQVKTHKVEASKPFPTKVLLVGSGAVAAVLVLVAGISVFAMQPSAPSSTDQLAISARLAPTNIDELTSINLDADTGNEFSLQANKAAWIEVRGSDGTVFRSRQMNQGETYFPRTGAGWTITVRDAGAFEWRFGDDVYASVGEDEQALYSLSVDTVLQNAIAEQRAALADAASASRQAR